MNNKSNVTILTASIFSLLALPGCTELEMLYTTAAAAAIITHEPQEQRIEPEPQGSSDSFMGYGDNYGMNNSTASNGRRSDFADLNQVAVGIGDMGGVWVSRAGNTRYYLLESVGQGKVITVNSVAGTYFAMVIPITWSYDSSRSQFSYSIVSGSYGVGVETAYNASPKSFPPEQITWLDGAKKTFQINQRVYNKLTASSWASQHGEIMRNLSIAADKNNFYDSKAPMIENKAKWN